MKEKTYSIKELSDKIGKSQQLIYAWIKAGKVKTVTKRFGTQKRVTESELKRIQSEISDFVESEDK